MPRTHTHRIVLRHTDIHTRPLTPSPPPTHTTNNRTGIKLAMVPRSKFVQNPDEAMMEPPPPPPPPPQQQVRASDDSSLGLGRKKGALWVCRWMEREGQVSG